LQSYGDVKNLTNFCVFWKTTPYDKISVPKLFIATPIDVLCSNFVKFGWWKIGEMLI